MLCQLLLTPISINMPGAGNTRPNRIFVTFKDLLSTFHSTSWTIHPLPLPWVVEVLPSPDTKYLHPLGWVLDLFLSWVPNGRHLILHLAMAIYYIQKGSPCRMETVTHIKPPDLSTFDVQPQYVHLECAHFAAFNGGNAKRQMPVLMCRCRWHRPGIEGQVVNPTAHLIHGMPGRIPVLTVPQQNGVKTSKDESDFMDFYGTFYGELCDMIFQS